MNKAPPLREGEVVVSENPAPASFAAYDARLSGRPFYRRAAEATWPPTPVQS